MEYSSRAAMFKVLGFWGSRDCSEYHTGTLDIKPYLAAMVLFRWATVSAVEMAFSPF